PRPHVPPGTAGRLQTHAGAGRSSGRPTVTPGRRAGGVTLPWPSQREGVGPMLLRHATLARNLNSILRLGLLTSFSRGKLPVVWACSPARSSWAVLHVVKRHRGRVESTVVLEVDLPRSWLRRSRKGLWYTARDIFPDRIRRVLTFGELAGTSIDS